jgi:hypothetical protein
MVDDRTEMLIRRNRLLLKLAAMAREEARAASALAAKRIAILTDTLNLVRLQHPRTDSDRGAETISWC